MWLCPHNPVKSYLIYVCCESEIKFLKWDLSSVDQIILFDFYLDWMVGKVGPHKPLKKHSGLIHHICVCVCACVGGGMHGRGAIFE